MESDVLPGMLVVMSRPRKSRGGVEFAFKVFRKFPLDVLYCCRISCDKSVIDVEEYEASAIIIEVTIDARFIGAGF